MAFFDKVAFWKYPSKIAKLEGRIKSLQHINYGSDFSISQPVTFPNIDYFLKSSQNTDILLYFFNNISEINSIITYIGQKASDIPKKHVKILNNNEQKDLGETDFLKSLKKPNHLDTGRTFWINSISSYFVFGYTCINFIKPSGFDYPSKFFLLPGNKVYPIPEKSYTLYGLPEPGADFRTNLITKYRFFIDYKYYDFLPEEIIFLKDSNLSFDNGAYLKGQSRLFSAQRSIKCLSYLYDTINNLLNNKGAAGIIYKKNIQGFPDTGWNPEDKRNVEDALNSYGTTGTKSPIAVTDKELAFLNLILPMRDFMPVELKEHEFRTLCTALLFPGSLLNDTKSSTYNNVTQLEKAMYTNCLMPVNNSLDQAITESSGLAQKGEAIISDYSNVECLQEDHKLKAEINNINNNLFEKLWQNNIATKNEWLKGIGQLEKSDPNFNKLKNELKENGGQENATIKTE